MNVDTTVSLIERNTLSFFFNELSNAIIFIRKEPNKCIKRKLFPNFL
jgi:hypothetical protein